MMFRLTFDNILSRFSADVGIDLGTSNTPIIVKGTGVRLREPSYVAYDLEKKKIIAIGHEAKVMYGRNHRTIEIIRPIKDGAIGNFEMASSMLEFMLRRIKNYGLFRPRIMIGVQTNSSEVERRAIQEAARLAGARVVYIIKHPIAAALGADIAILDSKGAMILDLGGGTSEVTVISLGGIVASRSSTIAGEKMDEAVQSMARKKYNLLIGEITAEEIKIKLGSAIPFEPAVSALVKGRDLASGLPRAVQMSSEDIYECLQESIAAIVELIKNCLESTPPEIMGDIIDSGIMITGGLSQLNGLDICLSKSLGLPCHVATDPAFAVARGIERILKEDRLMKALVKDIKKKHHLNGYQESTI
jgi:rod shape-determining protein MreB and related proteins